MEDDILGYFGIESSDGKKNGRPSETVAGQFRRMCTMPPLDYLLRAEDTQTLKRRGTQLQELCLKHFEIGEYGFLLQLLGGDFGKRLRMPIEFRYFTDREFIDYFMDNKDIFRIRLWKLRENKGLSGNGTKGYSKNGAENPFLLAEKEDIVKRYESVRLGADRFPKGFFDPENKRVGTIILRYLIENVLKLPHDKVLAEVDEPTLRKHKLGLLVDITYKGSKLPVYDAINDAFPRAKYPEVYNTNHKPLDPLQRLFDDLEAH